MTRGIPLQRLDTQDTTRQRSTFDFANAKSNFRGIAFDFAIAKSNSRYIAFDFSIAKSNAILIAFDFAPTEDFIGVSAVDFSNVILAGQNGAKLETIAVSMNVNASDLLPVKTDSKKLSKNV